MEKQLQSRSFICCFDDRDRMKRVLARLKEEELGISIVISGVTSDVVAMAREVGLTPHTVNLSLGIWGRTERLPKGRVLEFITMCGHSLVAGNLVEKAVADVRAGAATLEEAARIAGEPCICGIVNLTRAADLLEAGAAPDRN